MTGAVFYRGPSMLTGDAIIGALSGLEGESLNAKTGPVVQAWILRADRPPMDAKRANVDDAICGDCKLRGRDGVDSGCYVTPWLAPYNVWKAVQRGLYHDASWPDVHALVEGRVVRLGAYGDPAAIPFEVWRQVLATAGGWIGYSHSWRTCDERFKSIVMASVDSEREFFEAGLRGWRTFRVRREDDRVIAGAEFVCPASDEGGHRSTCQRCQLCRGTTNARVRSVVIIAHGKQSNLKAFGIDARRRTSDSSTSNEAPKPEPLPLLRSKNYRPEARS